MTGARLFTVLLSMLIVGCVRETSFDPIANRVTLSGSWTLAGQPATECACDEVSLERVVLVFTEPANGQDFEYTFSQLDCRCPLGGFDSRNPIAENGCSEARLAYGVYDVQWVFLDRKRNELARGDAFTIDASEGGPCEGELPEDAKKNARVPHHCDLPAATFPEAPSGVCEE